jgi:hypothetical protein
MIEASKYYALAITCGAKRGPKDSDLTFSPASLRDFLEALAQPEQEPVQFKCTVIDDVHPNGIPLEQWPSPPQRTWVDLTDEEENEYNYLGPDMYWVIQEIAAKLKEKNT